MKIAIMQPYFFPYIGYFQLIRNVEQFIIYDNIKYTKKGWINRNRIFSAGGDLNFSLSLTKGSDASDIRDRFLTEDNNRRELLRKLNGTYRKAPYFRNIYPLIQEIMEYDQNSLFDFLKNSLVQTCRYLRINTPITISSEIDIDHSLKSTQRVIALCKKCGADVYINPPGGIDSYSKEAFKSEGLELRFLNPKLTTYKQFENQFVPWLSIIDVMMFNSVDAIEAMLDDEYELT